MSSVPSMEAEGITRACTMVPVIRKNARATQTQESSSRTRSCRKVLCSAAGEWLGAPAASKSRPGERLAPASGLMDSELLNSSLTEISLSRAFFRALGRGNRNGFAAAGRHADFELYVFADVGAGITGSAEAAGGVAYGAAQAFDREIADRVGVEE